MIRNCQDCNEPIADKRLKALPNARRCIKCETTAGTPVIREDRVDLHRFSMVGDSGYIRPTVLPRGISGIQFGN